MLSEDKRITYLEAEFPHFWPHISKFSGGKAEYTESAMRNLIGATWTDVAEDLNAIGFLAVKQGKQGRLFRIPHLYRKGMDITQGSTRG